MTYTNGNGNGNGHRPAREGSIRVAVVGLGYWGPNLVRNLYEVPEAEVVAVCDLRPEALEPIGRRYPAVRRTTQYRDVLLDPAIEAVADRKSVV